MHCGHCESKIRIGLLKLKNIKAITFDKNVACIEFVENINMKEVVRIINDLDYTTKEEYISEVLNNNIKIKEFIVISFIIISLVFFANKIFGINIFNMIPNIDSNISYGMLFVTGLLTSIHCISMCGAINLLASTNTSNKKNFRKPILYNLGRLASYTLLGGIVGFIGKVISINYLAIGIVIILASLLMFIVSLKMLGIINLRLPHLFKKKFKNNNSLVIGLLNGLMPCGPLQAMELYALATGSFLSGALSLFLFGLGTIPLMLVVGLVVNLFKGKRKILINKISSIMVLLLSLVMLNRGLVAVNIDLNSIFNTNSVYLESTVMENYQLIEFDLKTSGYQDISVQKDILVKIIIHVDKENLTGCNNALVINEYNINKKLVVGDNIIYFIPNKSGTFIYNCWMNMLTSSIKVVEKEK